MIFLIPAVKYLHLLHFNIATLICRSLTIEKIENFFFSPPGGARDPKKYNLSTQNRTIPQTVVTVGFHSTNKSFRPKIQSLLIII